MYLGVIYEGKFDDIMANLDNLLIKLALQMRSKTLVNANDKKCNIWQGATTSDGKYGRKRVTFPDGNSKLMRVSRVVYLIKYKTFNIPDSDESGNPVEMSHLCHNSLCVNPDHLVLESKTSNLERKHCHSQNNCTETHFPHCIM